MSSDYKYKFDHFLFLLLSDISQSNILEFDVQKRAYTYKFLKYSTRVLDIFA